MITHEYLSQGISVVDELQCVPVLDLGHLPTDQCV